MTSDQCQHSEMGRLSVYVETLITCGKGVGLPCQRADQVEVVDQGEGIEHTIPVSVVIALATDEEKAQQPSGVKIPKELSQPACNG